MRAELLAQHPKILAECAVAERLRRLPGIQANASSEDVTQLDASSKTISDPVLHWAKTMLELHEAHQVPILGGCCGTSLSHMQQLI